MRTYLHICACDYSFIYEPHIGWCNDNATSNPLYSHAIRIARRGVARTKFHPRSSADQQQGHSPFQYEKKGSRIDFAWGLRRVIAGRKRQRAKPGNNSKLPEQRDSAAYAIWRFLLKEPNGFATWHLRLPRTECYIEITQRSVTRYVYRTFRISQINSNVK